MANGECPVGSANKTAIEALTGWQKRQDEAMKEQANKMGNLNEKLDRFNDNFNRILGGVVVACVLMVINIVITFAN